MIHKYRVASCAIGMTLLMALPSTSHAETLRLGISGGPQSLDPHHINTGTHMDAMRHVFDTLTVTEADLSPGPGLAVSWERTGPLTWMFKLREDVVFHDGSPFDASDVKASLERIPVVAGKGGSMESYISKIEKMEIVDPHTVIFTTRRPTSLLARDLTNFFIISDEAVVASDGSFVEMDAFNSRQAAIGTGPYKVDSWELKNKFVVSRFDDYWGEPQDWERVEILELSAPAARVAALLSGQVDAISQVPFQDVEAVTAREGIAISSGPSVVIFNLFPSFSDDTSKYFDADGNELPVNPLKDIRVRRALSLSIDRQTIVDRVLDGFGGVPSQFLTEAYPGYVTDLPPFDYDPEKARALLAEAGYPDGFSISMKCTNGRYPGDDRICASVGQYFSRVGVTTEGQAVAPPVLWPQVDDDSLAVSGYGWGLSNPHGLTILDRLMHSRDMERKFGSSNYRFYQNKNIDEMIETAFSTADESEQIAIIEEAVKTAVDDVALISVVQMHTVGAMNSEKVTYNVRPDGRLTAMNVFAVGQ